MDMISKQDALSEINQTQDFYVQKLIDIISNTDTRFSNLKEIDFTSPTGTGKTVMLAKLINILSDYFFVITSLSRGQLRYQIESKIKELAKQNNFIVFGLNEYTKTTKMQEAEIISHLPFTEKMIWIRDEGHIATNRWQEVLRERASHIINFSATNKNNNGVQCNFTHTMMLRTPVQNGGLPEDALDKLKEIKEIHESVQGYNPCALFRLFNNKNVERVVKECEKRGLKCINITSESYDMSEICKDNNEYDVIINKLKITEGIDLKRCHVIYMDNKPQNEATIVQIIGRARRNALFWRNDIDILDPNNSKLLAETRKCYVFYNVPETEIEQNTNGELLYALCDTISIEQLKPNISVHVVNGQLDNGLNVLELAGKSGTYKIHFDVHLQANVVSNNEFYEEKIITNNPFCLDFEKLDYDFSIKRIFFSKNIGDFFVERRLHTKKDYDDFKFFFFLAALWIKKNEINFDIEKWAYLLNVDDKSHLVKRSVFYLFKNTNPILTLWLKFICGGFKKYFSKEEISDACAFSKIKEPDLLQSRNIFVKSPYNTNSVVLDDEIIKYIDSIEYYDCSLADRINNQIDSLPNVLQLSSDRYRLSDHPFSKYLVNKRKIKTFKELKELVTGSKGSRVLYAKKTYWLKIFEKVSTFKELDSYETRTINLKELIEIFNLHISDNDMYDYVNNIYPLNKISGEKFLNLGIYSMNHFKDNPVPCIKKSFHLYKYQFDSRYVPYNKIVNDYEIAVIGPDNLKYSNKRYIEDTPVTSKISKYSKLNRFISNRYSSILENYKNKFFHGINDFGFDRVCNSCIGFCVENYAKMKLYGVELFKAFVEQAQMEYGEKVINDVVLIRAAILLYRQEMISCYGQSIFAYLPGISVENLIKEQYKKFIDTVVTLGQKTYEFMLNHVFCGKISKTKQLFDPNLSVNHISGLCDFLTEDTIVELKCTSSIEEKHLKQVLAYHYLSTKRSDLHIKRVIVYDAVTGQYIEADINM